MAVTGGKYVSTALSAVGTTTVTVGAATFSSGDFGVTRLVGLWNSAGTAFKGMAWVRRFVSTTQLELETAFFDPALGPATPVTQVIGDTVLVSQNFTEVSGTNNITTTNKSVSCTTAAVVFGAAASNSVCFYDEAKEIAIGTGSTFQFLGGLTVFGKLDNYATNSVSSPCDIFFTSAGGNIEFRTSGANANFCMYGGVFGGAVNGNVYIGGYAGGGSQAGTTMVFNSVQNPFDFISPGAGGTWGGTASRAQLVNCFSLTTAGNAIMRRWGDGAIVGGAYKFPNNTNAPISAFGADAAGTFTVAASAGDRAVVLDMGNGPALVRCGAANGTALIFNFTNLITTDFRTVTGAAGTLVANNGATNTFSFNDTWSGLQTASVGVVLNNSGAVAASVSSTGTTWSPSLLRRTCVGATVTVNATSWTFGIKRYGYQILSGSITPTTYDLGTAGSADNVAFGGNVVQAQDTGTTLTQTAANALTTIANLDQLYDAAVNWAILSTTNAQYPNLAQYPITFSGTALSFIGNIVLDSTASTAFAINTGTNTITIKAATLATGTKFQTITATGTITATNGAVIGVKATASAGSNGTLQLTNIPTSSQLMIQNATGTQQVFNANISGTYNLTTAIGSTGTWRAVVNKPGFYPQAVDFSATGATVSDVSLSAILNPDGTTLYGATTPTTCSIAFVTAGNATISIANGAASLQDIFDVVQAGYSTLAGMRWLAAGNTELSAAKLSAGFFIFLPVRTRFTTTSGFTNAAVGAFALSADNTVVTGSNPITFLVAATVQDSLDLVLRLLKNRTVTNPTTGKYTVYADDNSTVMLEGSIFEDVAGNTAFGASSTKILRRDRLT